jgi:hypothetical protein
LCNHTENVKMYSKGRKKVPKPENLAQWWGTNTKRENNYISIMRVRTRTKAIALTGESIQFGGKIFLNADS